MSPRISLCFSHAGMCGLLNTDCMCQGCPSGFIRDVFFVF